MDYYGNNDWRDYHLSHYGVKGMKKGKHLPGTTWWKEGLTNGNPQVNRDIQNHEKYYNQYTKIARSMHKDAKVAGTVARYGPKRLKGKAKSIHDFSRTAEANSVRSAKQHKDYINKKTKKKRIRNALNRLFGR